SSSFIASNATTTNFFATTASSTNLFSQTASLGSLSLGSPLAASSGGTGTSTAPSYGQLLIGNASGGYNLVATSSLGISGSGGGTWGSITGTLSNQTDLQTALNAKLNL